MIMILEAPELDYCCALRKKFRGNLAERSFYVAPKKKIVDTTNT